MQAWRAAGKPIPGYGHPLHKERDERVGALFDVSRATPAPTCASSPSPRRSRRCCPRCSARTSSSTSRARSPRCCSAPASRSQALKGVPILARTAGLIAHLYEEMQQPIGFALSYQATREMEYDGDVPAGFGK